MTCDVNRQNPTTIANGSFEAASIANGVLYLGGADGYTQSVSLLTKRVIQRAKERGTFVILHQRGVSVLCGGNEFRPQADKTVTA